MAALRPPRFCYLYPSSHSGRFFTQTITLAITVQTSLIALFSVHKETKNSERKEHDKTKYIYDHDLFF